jgi:hypothetical protein
MNASLVLDPSGYLMHPNASPNPSDLTAALLGLTQRGIALHDALTDDTLTASLDRFFFWTPKTLSALEIHLFSPKNFAQLVPVALAIETLGLNADEWLMTQSRLLEKRIPITLLTTCVGRDLVCQALFSLHHDHSLLNDETNSP